VLCFRFRKNITQLYAWFAWNPSMIGSVTKVKCDEGSSHDHKALMLTVRLMRSLKSGWFRFQYSVSKSKDFLLNVS